jgi:hypothetical protein
MISLRRLDNLEKEVYVSSRKMGRKQTVVEIKPYNLLFSIINGKLLKQPVEKDALN